MKQTTPEEFGAWFLTPYSRWKENFREHSNRKKSADDKGKGVVEGSIKTRCTGLWIRLQWFMAVFLRIASRKETEAVEVAGLHCGTSFLPLYPILGTVPLTGSHDRLLL